MDTTFVEQGREFTLSDLIYERLGIEKGDPLAIFEDNGRLILQPVEDNERLILQPSRSSFEAFSGMRDEKQMSEVDSGLSHEKFAEALKTYLAQYQVRKLQIGAGTNVLEGWFNTDVSLQRPEVNFLDSTMHYPIANETFDYVLSEHHIEHLPYESGTFMLRECFRIMKPGGIVRIATPNLATIIELYFGTLDGMRAKYVDFISRWFLPKTSDANPVFVINNAFYNWGHRFLYDEETLKQAMITGGFIDISRFSSNDSTSKPLQHVDLHGQFIGDEEINQFETMVLEGKRPLESR